MREQGRLLEFNHDGWKVVDLPEQFMGDLEISAEKLERSLLQRRVLHSTAL
jgi:hypothetical protein